MLPILTAAMQLVGNKQKEEEAKKQKRIDAASGNLGGGAQPQAQGNGLQNALGMLGQFKGGGGNEIQADGLSGNTKGALDAQFGQPGSVSDEDLLDAY